MKSHFQEMHGKRNCVIHRSCADSNAPFISQDQYVLMQKLFTMTNITKLYMFLIATKDHFCFHGNQWYDFNSDMTYDKRSYLFCYSTYICKIGIKLKFIEQPLLSYQRNANELICIFMNIHKSYIFFQNFLIILS